MIERRNRILPGGGQEHPMTRASFLLVMLVPLPLALPGRARAEGPAGVIVGPDSRDGRPLLGELNCVGCHDPGKAAERMFPRQAPLLGAVGARVTPEYLRAFLSSPQEVKPATPMPDLLHGLPAAEREDTLEVLVHFLTSLGGPLAQKPSTPAAKQVGQGKLLYHSVGCVACHPAFEPPPRHKIDPNSPVPDEEEKEAPKKSLTLVPLGDLARKTTVESLAGFLANPLHVRPSGRMPSLSLSAEEARAIAAYLLREQAPRAATFVVEEAKARRGKEIFAKIGCASCHDTGTHKQPERLDLVLLGASVKGVAPKDNRSPPHESPQHAIDNSSKTKYLNFGKEGSGLVLTIPGAPLLVTGLELTSANDSPDRDPASYLLEGSTDGKTFARIDARTVPAFPDRFKSQIFEIDNDEAYSVYRLTFPTLRGAGHGDAMQIAEVRFFASPKPLPGVASTLKTPPLAKLNPEGDGGCLAEQVKAGRPRFAFSSEQRRAVRDALAETHKPAAPATAEQRIEQVMGALNCYACHRRGSKGGPDGQRTAYFTYEVVVDMGDEGRLPPALHEVGAKLTPSGFEDVLLAGRRYRTAMATRMPLFGRANVGHLPDLFRQADAGKVPAYKPEFAPRMVAEGRLLAGNKALACVNCHAWGGHRVPGAEGLDLLQAVTRLRPEWFHALLVDPQQLKPRTRMPGAWPKGQSFFPAIEKGDMHRQIDTLWAYLSVGERGGPPSGLTLVGQSRLLVPGDEPIVFRTFLDGVSAHAILVGFRERTHVAFDANRVRMVLAWSGDFIETTSTWEGRGGEYARLPSPDVVAFPEGPPLAVLPSLTAKWPTDVPKAKMGTNRAPEGWRYLGYRYDDKRLPTFLYRAGPVAVEESPSSDYRQTNGCLIRRLRLTADEEVKDLYFRVAVGKKIVEKDGAFVIDDRLRYRVKAGGSLKPQVRSLDGQQELLVPIAVGPDREARLEVELTWGPDPAVRKP
jgi:mono/diheme cytochrome c family protein